MSPRCVPLGVWLVGLACLAPVFAPPPRRPAARGKKLAALAGGGRQVPGGVGSDVPYTERDVEQLAGLLLASGYRPEHVRVPDA